MRGSARIYDVRMAQFVLKIENLSHIIGARGSMIWDNFSIFRTNCAILTSYIRADPRTCRGSRVDVATLRDQMVRFERLSCVFFTAMAGNKAGNTNQGAYM